MLTQHQRIIIKLTLSCAKHISVCDTLTTIGYEKEDTPGIVLTVWYNILACTHMTPQCYTCHTEEKQAATMQEWHRSRSSGMPIQFILDDSCSNVELKTQISWNSSLAYLDKMLCSQGLLSCRTKELYI